jgi:ABC-type transport system involved in multi-copper enzyme maturation permease subunit
MLTNILALSGVVIRESFRRKDFYVLFVLTALITLLLASVNIFNDDRIVRYLKEICLLLIWVSSLVIAIGMAARQLPSERENRTLFPLLAKPVTRGQVVVGKCLGCWLASGLALVVFYVLLGVVTGAREHQWPLGHYLQAFWLHWFMLAPVIALTILGSILLSTPAATATFCFIVVMGILLVGRHLGKVAVQLNEPGQSILYAVYYVIPHLEFFDLREILIHNASLAPWWAVGCATLYALAYAALFAFGGWLAFRRKALN